MDSFINFIMARLQKLKPDFALVANINLTTRLFSQVKVLTLFQSKASKPINVTTFHQNFCNYPISMHSQSHRDGRYLALDFNPRQQSIFSTPFYHRAHRAKKHRGHRRVYNFKFYLTRYG